MNEDITEYYTDAYDCNDPANEPRPDSVVYTAGFHKLQKSNKAMAALLRDPLINSKFKSSITEGLIKEITKRTKEDFPDQVKFAIVGDMKAGQSHPHGELRRHADKA
jgi:hypothetical protein